MNRLEWRAVFSLGALYALRMVGMFMILPVFALYANQLPGGAQAWQIGVAIGLYGLTQALLQIPLGLLSDRIGRKPVIVAGMLVFALGSILAALSQDIWGIMAGRALQGAGAISSAVAALLADVTRPQVRTTAMAILGAGMGLAFILALVLGPVVAGVVGVQGIFGLTAVLALVSIPVVIFAVPTPELAAASGSAGRGRLRDALADGQLLRLDGGIFMLHACMTALFTSAPFAIVATLGLESAQHWKLYLPVLLVSIVPVFPLIRWAEDRQRMKPVFLSAIATLSAAFALAAAGSHQAVTLIAALLLFFVAFNFLEGALPSMISRRAPPERKGAALGAYATSQFLGGFAGGALGGFALGHFGPTGVFACAAALPLLWLTFAFRFDPVPQARDDFSEIPRHGRRGS